MRILGIDFGLKKIGLAIAENGFINPLGLVKNKEQIARICQEQAVEKIVIGLSEKTMGRKTRQFGEELKKLTNLPLVYQDETLTSEDAKNLMVEISKPKKKRQEQIDLIAACLILQNYLEKGSS